MGTETLTGSGWALRLGLDSARTLRVDLMPPLSSEATSRRRSSLGFSSTGQTLHSESNPPFLDRVAPTSTSSTSLAVDQVFLFMNPSYLSNQPTKSVFMIINRNLKHL